MTGPGRPKGIPKTGGRVKGTKNVMPTVRERFEQVFALMQEDPTNNLLEWARTEPKEFYKLSARLLPVDMAVQGAMTVNVITGVPTASAGEEDLA